MTSTQKKVTPRRAATAAAVVALVMTGGGFAFASHSGAQTNAKATVSGTASVARRTAVARVVASRERIDAGRGNAFWLTTAGELVADVPSSSGGHMRQPVKVLSPNFAVGSIGVRTFGDGGGTLYVGAYRGPGKLVKVTVTSAGVTLDAKVFRLAGKPGWAAFSVDGPALTETLSSASRRWIGAVEVTGYAADGTVLAQLKPPVVK